MKTGDTVKYEALGTGDLYDAKITAVRHDGKFFDIEIIVPGQDERIKQQAVRASRLHAP